MSSALVGRCSLVFVILPLIGHSASLQERFVTIPFELRSGLSFEERGDHSKEIHIPGQPPEIVRYQLSTRFAVRVTPEGYTITQSPGELPPPPPRDATSMVNGLIANARLMWDLDKNGRLQRVRGYQALMEQITSEMTKAMKQVASETGATQPVSGQDMLNLMLAPLGIRDGDPSAYLMKQWNSRQILGFQAGVTVPIGQTLRAEERLPIPSGGSVSIVRVTKVNEGTCGSRRCLTIAQVAQTDGEVGTAMTDLMRSMLGSMLSVLGRGSLLPKDLAYEDSNITTELVRTMDSQSGMILTDINNQQIELTLVTPGERSRVTLKTKSTYVYTER